MTAESKAEEECLEWYFEEHLKFPFTNQVKALEVAASISRYGEKLFEQVFAADHRILSTYTTAVQAGLDKIQIEIIGQPPFHALHWEALKDPKSPQPLALQVTILRQNLLLQAVYTDRHPSPTINLLIVTARPRGMRDMGYRTVSGPLIETLRQAEVPVQVEILRPGTYKCLENHLHEITSRHGVGYYHVIHFDVHGSLLTDQEFRGMNRSKRTQRPGRQDIHPYEGLKAFLALEGEEDGTADLVEAEELATTLIEHQIPIVILNACQSGKQVGERETSLGSYLMQAGIQMVVAMGYTVTVSATELLMRTLYRHLFAKDDLAVSMRYGRTALYNHKSRRAYFNQMIELEDWLLPVVYQNQQPTLQVRANTPEESAAFNRRTASRYASPQPRYGFVGRDLDILQIEKRLLMKRNMLLVRGMGGAGKTTLLHYLG